MPAQNHLLLYANNGKAAVEPIQEYREKVKSKGPLHGVRTKLCVAVSCAPELLFSKILIRLW